MKYFLFFLLPLLVQCNFQPDMQQEKVKIHAFRLKPGQDLRKEIEAYVGKEKIEAGWIITCVGSLTQTHLRFANKQDGAKFKGYFEIISLAGTVSINGCHLHLGVSDSLGRTLGGHLLAENLVYTTAEIVMGESKEFIFTREKDGTTSWEELQVKKKEDKKN
jgi:predicted DNA-binding protein with PD1-like motif